jgi:hypothetical protein
VKYIYLFLLTLLSVQAYAANNYDDAVSSVLGETPGTIQNMDNPKNYPHLAKFLPVTHKDTTSTEANNNLNILTADLLASACRSVATDSKGFQAAICVFTIQGYMDGFSHGANRGLRVAFIQDGKNLAAIEGIDNIQLRLSLLRKSAHCMPEEATVMQVVDVFQQYVKHHPEISNNYYAEPLTDAVESYFCSR